MAWAAWGGGGPDAGGQAPEVGMELGDVGPGGGAGGAEGAGGGGGAGWAAVRGIGWVGASLWGLVGSRRAAAGEADEPGSRGGGDGRGWGAAGGPPIAAPAASDVGASGRGLGGGDLWGEGGGARQGSSPLDSSSHAQAGLLGSSVRGGAAYHRAPSEGLGGPAGRGDSYRSAPSGGSDAFGVGGRRGTLVGGRS
jgi:hypothetical protein